MNLRKYLKVYKKFLHTSLASELEYKTNILVDLITAILSLIGSIFLLSIFFQNNGYIGGWKFEQALIIAFFFFIFNPESIWIPNVGILFLSVVSTFLSFLIQFLIQSIVACLCFWTEKASSIERLLFIPTLFLSGLLAPVVSFPTYVKSWIYLTPFPYLIDFPANLLSGNETNIIGGLSMQILWIFLLFPLFKKIWSEGTKKYTAMGS